MAPFCRVSFITQHDILTLDERTKTNEESVTGTQITIKLIENFSHIGICEKFNSRFTFYFYSVIDNTGGSCQNGPIIS